MLSWREMVAMDLDLPKYKTTMLEAVGFRLRRNYIHIFLIILGAWFVKLLLGHEGNIAFSDILNSMKLGPIPPAVVLGIGIGFYATLITIGWTARHIHGGEPEDEIAGLERNLEHWKL